MTEDEAKTKQCAVIFAGVAAMCAGALRAEKSKEQADAIGEASNCIGSDCMMWRWNVDYNNGQTKPPGGGYCGLAGKP